jgi:hypothetical protein
MGIAGKIQEKFTNSVWLRRMQEFEFIAALRQQRGVYDPDEKQKIQSRPFASTVYPKWTRSKTKPLEGKLLSMLFPTNSKNWEITPSNYPKVSQEVLNNIISNLQAQGGTTDR